MMNSIQKSLRWTLTLFSLFGIALVVAVLVIPEMSYSYLLKAAEYAAEVSIIALLLAVLVRLLDVEQRFSCMLLPDETRDQASEDCPERA